MKQKNLTKTIKLYYLILVTFLVTQVIATVFKLSQTVSYQNRIAQLQFQEKQLTQQLEKIEIELGRSYSLTALRNTTQQEYFPISSIVVISDETEDSIALKL